MSSLKSVLTVFDKPSAQQIMKTALENYQRELVASEAMASYSTKLSEYYREGITRLRSQLDRLPV